MVGLMATGELDCDEFLGEPFGLPFCGTGLVVRFHLSSIASQWLSTSEVVHESLPRNLPASPFGSADHPRQRPRDKPHATSSWRRDVGADGAFLINHGAIDDDELFDTYLDLVGRLNGFWLGVNCLSWSPEKMFRRAGAAVSGVWTDDALIDEMSSEQSDAATRRRDAARPRLVWAYTSVELLSNTNARCAISPLPLAWRYLLWTW